MSEKEINILMELQKETHSCIKDLQREIMRNSAMTVANGLKIGTAIENCIPCREKMAEIDLWKAGHIGEAAGKVHKASRFNTKTTLICTIGVTLLTLLGFWFTIVQPALNVSAEILSEFKAINGQFSELNILK